MANKFSKALAGLLSATMILGASVSNVTLVSAGGPPFSGLTFDLNIEKVDSTATPSTFAHAKKKGAAAVANVAGSNIYKGTEIVIWSSLAGFPATPNATDPLCLGMLSLNLVYPKGKLTALSTLGTVLKGNSGYGGASTARVATDAQLLIDTATYPVATYDQFKFTYDVPSIDRETAIASGVRNGKAYGIKFRVDANPGETVTIVVPTDAGDKRTANAFAEGAANQGNFNDWDTIYEFSFTVSEQPITSIALAPTSQSLASPSTASATVNVTLAPSPCATAAVAVAVSPASIADASINATKTLVTLTRKSTSKGGLATVTVSDGALTSPTPATATVYFPRSVASVTASAVPVAIGSDVEISTFASSTVKGGDDNVVLTGTNGDAVGTVNWVLAAPATTTQPSGVTASAVGKVKIDNQSALIGQKFYITATSTADVTKATTIPVEIKAATKSATIKNVSSTATPYGTTTPTANPAALTIGDTVKFVYDFESIGEKEADKVTSETDALVVKTSLKMYYKAEQSASPIPIDVAYKSGKEFKLDANTLTEDHIKDMVTAGSVTFVLTPGSLVAGSVTPAVTVTLPVNAYTAAPAFEYDLTAPRISKSASDVTVASVISPKYAGNAKDKYKVEGIQYYFSEESVLPSPTATPAVSPVTPGTKIPASKTYVITGNVTKILPAGVAAETYPIYLAGEVGKKPSTNHGSSSGVITFGPTPTPKPTAGTGEIPNETDPPKPAVGVENYPDVTADKFAWAIEDIDTLVKAGVIYGVETNKFAPDSNVTYVQFCAFILRSLKLSDRDTEELKKAEGKWETHIMDLAKKNELVPFLTDLSIKAVNESIPRADMFAIAAAALKKQGKLVEGGTPIAFTDAASIPEHAKAAIDSLSAMGICNGMGDNLLAPDGFSTRAQAAKVVGKLFNLFK